MKKVVSSIIAALVAVSFAGIVCAAEPALPPGHPPIKKEEKAPVKKAKKAKKTKKPKAEEKKQEAPAAPAEKK